MCLEGTREDIIVTILDWANEVSATTSIFWMRGMPGSGKSAIARTLVHILKRSLRLGSNFFFRRDDAGRRTPMALWCHMLYELSSRYPVFRSEALSALRSPDFQLGSSRPDDIVDIIFDGLRSLTDTDIAPGQRPVLVIDALDECPIHSSHMSRQRDTILRALARFQDLPSHCCKIIITSRDEDDIRSVLNNERVTRIFLPAGLSVDSQSSSDIRKYLALRLNREVPEAEVTEEELETLVDRAAGLFVWAKTAIEYIQDRRGLPRIRLESLLKAGLSSGDSGDLAKLYHLVMTDQFSDNPDPTTQVQFRRVTGAILAAATPLTEKQLIGMLSYPGMDNASPVDESTISVILRRLSTVTIRQDTGPGGSEVIQFSHLSFAEFLQNAQEKEFYSVKLDAARAQMASQCLNALNAGLEFNICRIPSSHYSNDHYDLHDMIAKHIPPTLQYAARHWATDLDKLPFSSNVMSLLDILLHRKLLFWFETMSILGMFSAAGNMLRRCARWLTVRY